MKITFILKDFDDTFFDGFGGSIVGLLNMPDAEKFTKLNNMSVQNQVQMKIGNGSFRDRVDLNSLLRGSCAYRFKLEPRRGYKLATFDVIA
jgi:hypothetical protein